jgi:hypothetical protein
MSGGSYDYLCDKFRWGDPFGSISDYLEDMAERCETLGKPEAAQHLRGLAFEMTRVAREGSKLSGLMQAVEWYVSGDWGPETIDEAVAAMKAP